ncbi:MAG: hypothetical protein JO202_07415 [Ktedonobacteraceae bacterium]|nr:hypothetical protein [Ktedonobacteraceae bacterium]
MYAFELNDEQLEMVAGGSTATSGAAGAQSVTVSYSSLYYSPVSVGQVVASSATAGDITGSYNNNEFTSQKASGAGDTQIA